MEENLEVHIYYLLCCPVTIVHLRSVDFPQSKKNSFWVGFEGIFWAKFNVKITKLGEKGVSQDSNIMFVHLEGVAGCVERLRLKQTHHNIFTVSQSSSTAYP